MRSRTVSLALAFAVPLALDASAGAAQNQNPLPYPAVGSIQPRHAREIAASPWSVGAETMDRDYTIYRNWRQYLGPLGVKKARIQAGWARTEKERGKYDWAWLDEIIPDIVAQGVEPWVNLSYGNPLYANGGGTLLGAGVPVSEEALNAWERWVRATVQRYGKYVDEWEVWNEPYPRNPSADYANLLLRSAEAIRAAQPHARVLSMALGPVSPEYADSVLAVVAQRNKLQLIDEITYHPYSRNPDQRFGIAAALREVAGRYAPHITIRQGENGAPSAFRRTKALNNSAWTELSQAKWALRRLLGDLGRDIPSSIFSIVDMKYPDEMNMKGLLRANEDLTVAYAKPAYYAVQNLAAIFDDRLERIPDYGYRARANRTLSVFGYRDRATGAQVVTVWFDDEVPSDVNDKTPLDITFEGGRFTDPVYVDLREGRIFDIPDAAWSRSDAGVTFRGVPVYDSPVLIAERSQIPTSPSPGR
ncbi:MAG: hypothetical protein KY464_17550 [Gemmatimonadetes bacterium]|nr:hypothetical protein [Gemmatimonadota bacterium]